MIHMTTNITTNASFAEFSINDLSINHIMKIYERYK